MSDFLTDKQMTEMAPASQAIRAIGHVLEQIRTEPTIGYLMGIGTQSFALLTEAFATLCYMEVSKAREEFMPKAAKDPRETYGEIDKIGDDPMPGGCPCCGGDDSGDDLRREIQDLVMLYAYDVLDGRVWSASDSALIEALKKKLGRRV